MAERSDVALLARDERRPWWPTRLLLALPVCQRALTEFYDAGYDDGRMDERDEQAKHWRDRWPNGPEEFDMELRYLPRPAQEADRG